MADPNFSLNFSVRGLPKPKAYDLLAEQLEALLGPVRDPLTAMATLVCVHHYGFEHLWTGFYRLAEESRRLWLGVFQGPLAELEHPFGQGTVGLAAEQGRAVVGTGSRPNVSELAVPLFTAAGQLSAVLRVRHPRPDYLDSTDRQSLERHLRAFITPLL